MHGTGIVTPRYRIHPYYTLKFIKFQVKLAKMGFFVNYDDFYVNIVMSTEEMPGILPCIIFNYTNNM